MEYGVINRLYSKKTNSTAQCFSHPKYDFLSQRPRKNDGRQFRKGNGACDDDPGPRTTSSAGRSLKNILPTRTFGGALVPGQRNVFDSTVDFTGIAFLTEPRLFSPIISRLRVQSGAADFQWALDYDPVLHQVNASTIFAGYRWNNWYLNGGQAYRECPGRVLDRQRGALRQTSSTNTASA